MLYRFTCLIALSAAMLVLVGCAASTDEHTFRSTQTKPKSVTLLDTTTGEALWSMDVPVGQRLKLEVTREDGAQGKKVLSASDAPATAMEWSLHAMYGDEAGDSPMQQNTIELPGHPVRISWTLRDPSEQPRAMLGGAEDEQMSPPGGGDAAATQPLPAPQGETGAGQDETGMEQNETGAGQDESGTSPGSAMPDMSEPAPTTQPDR